MSELTSKNRDTLRDSTFGIPSLRKYPLNDKEHVIKAIQMFHHCPLEYKKELASNINRQAKRYDITISNNSAIYDYLNESEQLDIDLLEDIYLMEQDLYLNEAFGMNEEQAKAVVDGAISCWKKRKTFVKNPKDKNRLVLDLKAENNAVRSLQTNNDLNGVLQRAKMTANAMGKKLASGDYDQAKKARGKGEFRGPNNSVGKLAKAGGIAAAGTVIGGLAGKRRANNKVNGKIVTGAKVAGGAAAGLAVGSLAAGIAVTAKDIGKRQAAKNVNDPDKPIRQHAERYANFLGNFQGEVIAMNPNGDQVGNNEGGEE